MNSFYGYLRFEKPSDWLIWTWSWNKTIIQKNFTGERAENDFIMGSWFSFCWLGWWFDGMDLSFLKPKRKTDSSDIVSSDSTSKRKGAMGEDPMSLKILDEKHKGNLFLYFWKEQNRNGPTLGLMEKLLEDFTVVRMLIHYLQALFAPTTGMRTFWIREARIVWMSFDFSCVSGKKLTWKKRNICNGI